MRRDGGERARRGGGGRQLSVEIFLPARPPTRSGMCLCEARLVTQAFPEVRRRYVGEKLLLCDAMACLDAGASTGAMARGGAMASDDATFARGSTAG